MYVYVRLVPKDTWGIVGAGLSWACCFSFHPTYFLGTGLTELELISLKVPTVKFIS